MRFRLLGPLEVWDGARWTMPAASKQRALLAVLLLHANQAVSADRLIDELWGEHLPGTPANLLQVYVSRLRKLLDHGPGGVLRTRSHCYELLVQPGDLDVDLFERLVQDGQQALRAGALELAAEQLTAALALWRGEPLSDVPTTTTVAAEVLRLQERRLTALEAHFEAELGLGRHAGVLPDLKEQVAACPLREGLRAHLMVALYRSGRQAEALGAYRDLRQILHDELAIEPSPSLRRLERAILTDDPALTPPEPATPPRQAPAAVTAGTRATGPVPCQLPPDVGDFTGRDEPLTRLRDLLSRDPGPAATSVVVCAISGTAGVGKTALAVHAAHQLAERFPTGSSTWTCRARPAGSARCTRWGCWAASCGRWEWKATPSPPSSRRRRPGSAPSSPPGGCRWCWTTPTTPPRSARCCRQALAARCSSPVAGCSPPWTRPTSSTWTCFPRRGRSSCSVA
jgi:DNA-binding SARP family transcriptional activator